MDKMRIAVATQLVKNTNDIEMKNASDVHD